MSNQTDMHFCQSCAMPMAEPAQQGTEKDGARSQDYCCYCYADGAFTTPEATMAQMIEQCVPFTAQATGKTPAQATGKTPAQARAEMEQYFPQLKRWK